jgi:hypothetical protein
MAIQLILLWRRTTGFGSRSIWLSELSLANSSPPEYFKAFYLKKASSTSVSSELQNKFLQNRRPRTGSRGLRKSWSGTAEGGKVPGDYGRMP